MPAILPPWTDADPVLHARLTAAIDPDRKVLDALERIVPLSGKRIADVGTGIGHYPMLLARRTGRTYGIESDPELLAEARRRAADAHQPNIRIVEGGPTSLPLRDGRSTSSSRPGSTPTTRRCPPSTRRCACSGRAGGSSSSATTVATTSPRCSSRRSVAATMDATQRRTGWWLRNGFKIKVVHARVDLSDRTLAHELLPRLYGDRGRAYLMGPAPPVAAPQPRPLPSWPAEAAA